MFVMKPEPQVVNEGDWAKFQCRVIGHPKPRLIWVLNGNTVVNVSETLYPKLMEFFTATARMNSVIRTGVISVWR